MQDSFVVHIVDDDEAVRQSLAFLLSTAGIPVRVYESATSFLHALPSLQAGCLITDVRMPDLTGIELLQRLKAKSIDLPVIVITGHGDIPLAVEAMKSGAIDFIEKPFAEEAILRAVRSAEERVGRQGHRSEVETALAGRFASLSERERQVLDGLVAGSANKTIAYDLGISPRTVEVYRANLMNKMQAKSLSELIRMALTIRPSD
jgi:two-component system, LuxR family, response regulator FixJ